MPAPPSGATAAGRSLIGMALEVNREVFVTGAVTNAMTSTGDRTGRLFGADGGVEMDDVERGGAAGAATSTIGAAAAPGVA